MDNSLFLRIMFEGVYVFQMWRFLLFLHIVNFANSSNVLQFNPTSFDAKFDERDIVKMDFQTANFSQGFSICFRILMTAWRSSCVFQSANGFIFLVNSLLEIFIRFVIALKLFKERDDKDLNKKEIRKDKF